MKEIETITYESQSHLRRLIFVFGTNSRLVFQKSVSIAPFNWNSLKTLDNYKLYVLKNSQWTEASHLNTFYLGSNHDDIDLAQLYQIDWIEESMNVCVYIELSQISLAKKCERGQTCFQFHSWNPLTSLFTSWLDLLQKTWILPTTQFVCLTPFSLSALTIISISSNCKFPFFKPIFGLGLVLWQIYSKKWLRKQRKKFILSYFFLLPDNSQSFDPCVCQETFYWG